MENKKLYTFLKKENMVLESSNNVINCVNDNTLFGIESKHIIKKMEDKKRSLSNNKKQHLCIKGGGGDNRQVGNNRQVKIENNEYVEMYKFHLPTDQSLELEFQNGGLLRNQTIDMLFHVLNVNYSKTNNLK